MEPPFLTSDGFAVAGLWVPPFEVSRGDCLEMRLPSYGAVTVVAASLTGKPAMDEVRGTSAVRFAQPAWDLRGKVARLLRPSPTAFAWLRPFTHSRDETLAVLREIDVDPAWRISHMPGNPRALLGLAAVWTTDVNIIVISMAGCDATGRRRLTEMIASRLDRWAAIELTSPYLHRGITWPGDSSLPNPRLVEVLRRPALVA
jgi:hypothetical protein